jgi:hypothetical protein
MDLLIHNSLLSNWCPLRFLPEPTSFLTPCNLYTLRVLYCSLFRALARTTFKPWAKVYPNVLWSVIILKLCKNMYIWGTNIWLVHEKKISKTKWYYSIRTGKYWCYHWHIWLTSNVLNKCVWLKEQVARTVMWSGNHTCNQCIPQ